MPAERRSCQTIALLSGLPLALSQARTVSPWLASATACAGARAAARARAPALTTELHSSSGSASTPSPPTAVVAHRDFRPAEDLVARANKQGLRRRRALVDGEDVHSAPAPGSARIAAGSVTSWTM